MKARLKDIKLAEDLYDQERDLDAIKLIDRMLEVREDMTVEELTAIIRNAMTAEDVGLESGMSSSLLADGTGKITLKMGESSPGGMAVPFLMLLRSKCMSSYLQTTKTKRAATVAVANSTVIWELFSGDAEMLAIAAQPFVSIREWKMAALFLNRALAIDPQNRFILTFIASIQRRGFDEPLAPERGFVPPPPRLKQPFGAAAAQETTPAAPPPAAPARKTGFLSRLFGRK